MVPKYAPPLSASSCAAFPLPLAGEMEREVLLLPVGACERFGVLVPPNIIPFLKRLSNGPVSNIYAEDLHIFQSRLSSCKPSRVATSGDVQWRVKISNIHIVCGLTMNLYIHWIFYPSAKTLLHIYYITGAVR